MESSRGYEVIILLVLAFLFGVTLGYIRGSMKAQREPAGVTRVDGSKRYKYTPTVDPQQSHQGESGH